jgi:hypothetical protein
MISILYMDAKNDKLTGLRSLHGQYQATWEVLYRRLPALQVISVDGINSPRNGMALRTAIHAGFGVLVSPYSPLGQQQ